MIRNIKESNTGFLCSLALFLVFTVCSLVVVAVGTQVYKSISKDTDMNFNINTTLSYINNKIHSSDFENCIELSNYNDIQVLVLKNPYDEEYKTLIYYYDNCLYELTKSDLDSFKPGNGEKLLSINKFRFEIKNDNIIEAICYSDSGTIRSSTKLHCNSIKEVTALE